MLFAEHLRTLAEISQHPGNMQRRSGALLDYLRWNFGHRIMDTEYVLPLIEGARLILSDRQNFAILVYTCGLWDFAEQAFLLHLLRPDDTFIDVGSNVGGYTVLASAVAGARSVAFVGGGENPRKSGDESVAFTYRLLARAGGKKGW